MNGFGKSTKLTRVEASELLFVIVVVVVFSAFVIVKMVLAVGGE